MGVWPQRLDLFGSIHYDRIGKVKRELAPLVDDADAVYVEVPERLPRRAYALAVLRAPLSVLGAIALELFVFLALSLVLHRDFTATEDVAVEQLVDDTPVHRVDEHPVELLADAGPWTIYLNWLVLFLVLIDAPIVVGTAVLAAALCWGIPFAVRRLDRRRAAVGLAAVGIALWYWLVLTEVVLAVVPLIAVIAYGVVVYRTMDHRNDHMLDAVVDHASAGDHEQVVLVTGKGHLSGIVDQARERNLALGNVHVSKWLRAGQTHADPTAVAATDGGASLRQRAGVWAVDVLAIGLLAACYLAVGGLLGTPANPVLDGAYHAGVVSVALGYRVGLQALWGATLGERLGNLTVVDVSGEPIGLRTALVRNGFWLADTLLLYLPALIDDENRLLCDYIVGTDVVAGRQDARTSFWA